MYTHLQLREVSHLEFLRWFGKKVRTNYYALKGRVNLRFFFNSFRYSEDMDSDIHTIKIGELRDVVMKILQSISFQDSLKSFGIEKVIPPDIKKAKQTTITQRFKIHLITSANEDLLTKVEFWRRGFKGNSVAEPVSDSILRSYKLPPLIVSHYDIQSTIIQKIEALSTRVVIQARDIFDLYTLSSQYVSHRTKGIKINSAKLTKACENVLEMSFEQFRDTVLSYLSSEEQAMYNSSSLWDEVKLKVANFIEEIRKTYA